MSAEFDQILPALVRGGAQFIFRRWRSGNRSRLRPRNLRCRCRLLARAREHRAARCCARANAPYLRDAPPNLPFTWDTTTIGAGWKFTLTTGLGAIDLFGEIAGGKMYDDFLPRSLEVEAFGVRFKCLDLPALIRVKEAAGRTKDHEAIAELRFCSMNKTRVNTALQRSGTICTLSKFVGRSPQRIV